MTEKLRQEVYDGMNADIIVNDPLFIRACERMESYLNGRESIADANDKDMCQKLIITRQLLNEFIKEFTKVVKRGDGAKIKLEQIEGVSMLNKIGRRMVR